MPAYHAKKRLGQNFLESQEVVQKIVDQISPQPGQRIVEIGPGRGVLTLPLAESGASLWAVEYDRDLIGYLRELLRPHENVKLINVDFLRFQPDEDLLSGFTLVGNLPFNITSPVLDWCAKYHRQVETAVLMMQKELSARVAASPGSKDWSPLSIFTQLLFHVDRCFEVSSESFNPPPEVTSAVIRLTRRESEPTLPTLHLRRVVQASFRQRRKLLVNNLVPDVIPDSDLARQILETLSLERNVRAEQVTIIQFLNLTNLLIDRKLL